LVLYCNIEHTVLTNKHCCVFDGTCIYLLYVQLYSDIVLHDTTEMTHLKIPTCIMTNNASWLCGSIKTSKLSQCTNLQVIR
jgi:hypothetical protein